jgi:hypothetical protein
MNPAPQGQLNSRTADDFNLRNGTRALAANGGPFSAKSRPSRWWVTWLAVGLALMVSRAADFQERTNSPLAAQQLLADAGFQFSLSGPVGRRHVIQKSSDLANWTELYTSYAVSNTISLFDRKSERTGHGFYRASEVDTNFVLVANRRVFATNRLVCHRFAVGRPDDYKPCVAKLRTEELVMCAFSPMTLADGS